MALFPFQVSGAEWLHGRQRAGLFDETGLGKTITAIESARRRGVRTMLCIVPSIVLWNWRNEIAEFWPVMRDAVHVIESGMDATHPRAESAPVLIVTPSLTLQPRVREALHRRRFDLLIVDEAQDFRGPTAQRTGILYGPEVVRDSDPGLVSRADAVWLLTGTPMLNNCAELWTHLRGLWPERLLDLKLRRPMSYSGYVKRFCRTRHTRYGQKIIGNANVKELRAVIDGLFLRRLKKDHLHELPALRYEIVTLRAESIPWELQAVEQKIRPRLVKLAQEKIDEHGGELTPSSAWAALRESSEFSNFAQLAGLAKVEPSLDLLTGELERKEVGKLFVAAMHLDVIEGLRAGFAKAGFAVETITGATSSKRRADIAHAFQTMDSPRVIVGQIKAAGVGVTLTAAQDVVMVEMSPTPGMNKQVADRCHRISQTQRVRVRCIALAKTADEDLIRLLRNKTRMIREIIK